MAESEKKERAKRYSKPLGPAEVADKITSVLSTAAARIKGAQERAEKEERASIQSEIERHMGRLLPENVARVPKMLEFMEVSLQGFVCRVPHKVEAEAEPPAEEEDEEPEDLGTQSSDDKIPDALMQPLSADRLALGRR